MKIDRFSYLEVLLERAGGVDDRLTAAMSACRHGDTATCDEILASRPDAELARGQHIPGPKRGEVVPDVSQIPEYVLAARKAKPVAKAEPKPEPKPEPKADPLKGAK